MTMDLDRIAAVRAAMPREGLFAEKDWLLTPTAFPLNAKFVEDLEKLGHRLNLFSQACNLLYQLSAQGRQPAWVADYLDRGKPRELIEYSRQKAFRNEIPRVIRPDLVLTEEGFTIAELDSVPGGIGLTAWLNESYSAFGESVVGGQDGMIEGFRTILPLGDIVVSEESATYKPEMEWLARRARERGSEIFVHDAKNYRTPDTGVSTAKREPRQIYRFFELFDLPNVPCAANVMTAAAAGEASITPPIKPFLEEKLWFALFWMKPLQEFWRSELGERHWLELQRVIPYTWIMDPTPLPHHAVIPGLEIQEWSAVGSFSQKQRELILKISGFSELGWGSRGVALASDMPQDEWRKTVERALGEFQHHPYILQRFHKGRLVSHPYFDPETGVVRELRGRVRLCPYFFLEDGKARLRGALATICPSDKKLLHGMRDAILAPCRRSD